jgi:transposase
MKIMAGIDLHSNNAVIGLINQDGQRLGHKKVPCDLSKVLDYLEPHRAQIERVAVESTFNWYWLVDGLQLHRYHVVLANPAAIKPYEGRKHADDKTDAYFLAELLRLGILPTGHIYDPQLRPVRDMLRRRMSLVHQRTALMLSVKSLYQRMSGINLSRSQVQALAPEEAMGLFTHSADQLVAQQQTRLISHYTEGIKKIEKEVLKAASKLPSYKRVTQLPGVGVILGLTITMETGPIDRFASAGNYASYCRCVDAGRYSNGKSKGDNNSKCGNKYLGWAFVEAAQYARRYSPECQRFYDRKEAQTNAAVATKALACKLSKAAWHLMRHGQKLDLQRMFPGAQDTGKVSGKSASPTPTSLTPLGNVS